MATPAYSEIIFLKDGSIIEDKIVERAGGEIVLASQRWLSEGDVLGVQYGTTYSEATISDGKTNITGILLVKTKTQFKLIVAKQIKSFARPRYTEVTTTKRRAKKWPPVTGYRNPNPESYWLGGRGALTVSSDDNISDFYLNTGFEFGWRYTPWFSFSGGYAQVLVKNADSRQVIFPAYSLITATAFYTYWTMPKNSWAPHLAIGAGGALSMFNTKTDLFTSLGLDLSLRLLWHLDFRTPFSFGFTFNYILQEEADYPYLGLLAAYRF